MKRREFLAGAGAAAVWPLGARAQQPGKRATIGLLASSTAAAELPRRTACLARPGGNVTGFSVQLTDTAGKRIELLREIVPDLRRLAILGNASNTVVALEVAAAQSSAGALGLDTVRPEFGRAEDIPSAIGALDGRADGL